MSTRSRLLIVLLLILTSGEVYSQEEELNQLLKELSRARGNEKLDAINDLASFYYNRDSLSELRFYLDEAFKLIANI